MESALVFNTVSSGKSEEPPPVTSEEFLRRSSSWTLACDNALLNRLKTFSENISKQSHEILMDCDSLSTQIDLLHSRVHTVTNEFLILSNTQFTENRVEEFQEMLTTSPNSQNVPVKSKAEKEAELIAKMKKAIKIGVAVKTEQQLKRDNPSEAVYQVKKLKLPYIIGTPKYFSSRYCGLADEMTFPAPSVLTPTFTEDEEIGEIPGAAVVSNTDILEQPQFSSVPVPSNDLKKSDNLDDLFFPTRELYVPPSLNQSFGRDREGSPGSDDRFIHRRTPSSATSSNSNLTQESEKKASSGSSFMENKPSAVDSSVTSARHGVPPPILDDNSDDSDDGFTPRPPGSGIRDSIFADTEDDMFGESSFGRARDKLDEADDLFSRKPPATVINLFGQTTRPSPILLPSGPPPILNSESSEPQNSTPPTLDVTVRDILHHQQSSVSEQFTASSLGQDKESRNNSNTLNQHSTNKNLPPPVSNFDDLTSQSGRTKVERINADSEGAYHVPSQGSDASLEKESKPLPKPRLGSFVKSMAVGLKIDPMALHPGAKPPRHYTQDTNEHATLPNEKESKNYKSTPVSSYLSDSEKPEVVTGTSALDSQAQSVQSTRNNKADAAETQIAPISGHSSSSGSAVAGAMYSPIHKNSRLSNISLEKTVEPSVTNETVPASPVATPAQAVPIPVLETPNVTTNNSDSFKTKASSIFDAGSSDDDLFSQKSVYSRQSKETQDTSSLFGSKSAVNQVLKASESVHLKNPEVPNVQDNIFSTTQQKSKTRVVAQKSIFDDSDSDDDLFSANDKSINTKKVRILFPQNEKDAISSSPNEARSSKNVGFNPTQTTSKSIIDKVQITNTVDALHETKIAESEPSPIAKLPSPFRSPSPLFSSQAGSDDEKQQKTSSSANVRQRISPLPKSKIFPIKTSVMKGVNKKSIFDDSDSEDDSLFRSSSSKNNKASKLGDKKTNSKQDSGIFVAECTADATGKLESGPHGQGTSVFNSSLQESTVSSFVVDSVEYQHEDIESLETSASKSETHLVINELDSNLISSKLSDTKFQRLPVEGEASTYDTSESEKGVSFEGVASTDVLASINITKKRAKVTARNRRPPTRKVAAKEVNLENATQEMVRSLTPFADGNEMPETN